MVTVDGVYEPTLSVGFPRRTLTCEREPRCLDRLFLCGSPLEGFPPWLETFLAVIFLVLAGSHDADSE
jgi:hypothetical protein